MIIWISKVIGSFRNIIFIRSIGLVRLIRLIRLVLIIRIVAVIKVIKEIRFPLIMRMLNHTYGRYPDDKGACTWNQGLTVSGGWVYILGR